MSKQNNKDKYINLCDWKFSEINDINLCNPEQPNQTQDFELLSQNQNLNTNQNDTLKSYNKPNKEKDNQKEVAKYEKDNSNKSKEEQVAQNINEFGTDKLPTKDDKEIQCITIIGEIEGHFIGNPQKKATKYEHIIPMLYSIEQDENIKGILIILNTVGGDVEAGLAMAELINSISKKVVTLVLGGSHSIGVPLATAGDYSFIAPSATMIVHPIRTNGLVIGVNETFEYFKKMQERINDFIIKNSKISKEDLNKLMHAKDELVSDVGSVLIGKEAVECGLINEVGGLKESLTKLKELIKENNNNKTT